MKGRARTTFWHGRLGIMFQANQVYTLPDDMQDFDRYFDPYVETVQEKLLRRLGEEGVSKSAMQALWTRERAHTHERRLELFEQFVRDRGRN